jgi:hypothetical protein
MPTSWGRRPRQSKLFQPTRQCDRDLEGEVRLIDRSIGLVPDGKERFTDRWLLHDWE